MTAISQRKSICTDAIKSCGNDPLVMCAVAQLFWVGHKFDKARTWLMKSVAINPDLGDLWAYLYHFELQHGTKKQQLEVLKKCQAAEPRHGVMWCEISKSSPKLSLTTASI